MIDEKFKVLEQRVLALIEENRVLKEGVARLNYEKESVIDAIRQEAEAQIRLSKESEQAVNEENEKLNAQNNELALHLKKIMARLESLGVQS